MKHRKMPAYLVGLIGLTVLLLVSGLVTKYSKLPEFQTIAEASSDPYQDADGQNTVSNQVTPSIAQDNNTTSKAVTSLATNQYTVQWGDSLYYIAGKYSVSVNDLMKANNLKTTVIKPGQVLVIPSSGAGQSTTYTVKTGDSLSYIANKYGISIASLKQANSLRSDTIYPGQQLKIPAKGGTSSNNGNNSQTNNSLSLSQIMVQKGINPTNPQLTLFVKKSAKTLTVYSKGVKLKSYNVELGDSGLGDKAVSGDHKTPEGTFYIAEKSIFKPGDEFLGTRWMRLSYPNIEDAQRGLTQGLIDQSTYNQITGAIGNFQIPPQKTVLGGGVGIHGGSTPSLGHNWTWGCVGLTDRDVEEFYDYVYVGTPVIIEY